MTIYYTTHLQDWFGKKISSPQNFTISHILREAASMYPVLGDFIDSRYKNEMYWITTNWIYVNNDEKYVVIQTEY